jgi:ribosomal protein S18 acetylase RimI-like enzyme
MVELPLLVRDAEPEDRLAGDRLVNAAGWSAQQRQAWREGVPAVVLYDPADATVHAIVVASPLGPGMFDLTAWTVASALDRRAAAVRLVEAIANRVRRGGGERLVVTVHDEAAGSLLEACGFHVVSRRDQRSADGVSVLTYHLEL